MQGAFSLHTHDADFLHCEQMCLQLSLVGKRIFLTPSRWPASITRSRHHASIAGNVLYRVARCNAIRYFPSYWCMVLNELNFHLKWTVVKVIRGFSHERIIQHKNILKMQYLEKAQASLHITRCQNITKSDGSFKSGPTSATELSTRSVPSAHHGYITVL